MLKSPLLLSSEVQNYLSGVFDLVVLEDRLGLTSVLPSASASRSDWRRRFTRLLTLLALIVGPQMDPSAWVRKTWGASEPTIFWSEFSNRWWTLPNRIGFFQKSGLISARSCQSRDGLSKSMFLLTCHGRNLLKSGVNTTSVYKKLPCCLRSVFFHSIWCTFLSSRRLPLGVANV